MIDSSTGKIGIQKRFMVSIDVYTHIEALIYCLVVIQKLESTLHGRQLRTSSLLHVNLHKNRYTDKDMLPCKYTQHTHTHTHTHTLNDVSLFV